MALITYFENNIRNYIHLLRHLSHFQVPRKVITMNRLVPVTLKASAITALSYTWSSHSASENLSGFVDSSNSLPPISTPARK